MFYINCNIISVLFKYLALYVTGAHKCAFY